MQLKNNVWNVNRCTCSIQTCKSPIIFSAQERQGASLQRNRPVHGAFTALCVMQMLIMMVIRGVALSCDANSPLTQYANAGESMFIHPERTQSSADTAETPDPVLRSFPMRAP